MRNRKNTTNKRKTKQIRRKPTLPWTCLHFGIGLPSGQYLMADPTRGMIETVDIDKDGRKSVVRTDSIPGAGPAAPKVLGIYGNFLVGELAVGGLYRKSMTRMPDGGHLLVTPACVELALFLTRPTPEEIGTIQGKDLEVFLVERSHTMVLVTKFGELWFEAPYSVHRVPEELRQLPRTPEAGYGWRLVVAVVDADTGVIAGMRELGLSTEFSLELQRVLSVQSSLPADHEAHTREVMELQSLEVPALAAIATATCVFRKGSTAA